MNNNLTASQFSEEFSHRTTYTENESEISSNNTTQATDHVGGEYAGFNQKAKTMGKEFDEKNATAKDPIKFSSKEEMLRQVKIFFSLIDPALGERMNQVMNNPMIRKDIQLTETGPCSGGTFKEGDAIRIELRITPDGKGLVALAQEIANAYIYGRYIDQKKQEDQARIAAIKETSSKFFGLLLIEHLSDKVPNMTPQQKEKLQYAALNKMSPNIFAKEEDQELFDKIMQDNPERFLECETPEDYIIAFNEIVDNPTSNIFGEEVTDRVEEIAEENPGEYLGTKEVVEEISDTVLKCISLEGTEEFFEHAKHGDSKKVVLDIVNGACLTEYFLNKGYTQEQLNSETIKNKIEKLNQQEHVPLEKIQEISMEMDENVPVMEMKKEYNNNN